ncbi:MAG: CBS domain-containing protein [Thermoleophilia bacterium]
MNDSAQLDVVRNWMQSNPMTITSDTLASEAKRLLVDNNLNVLVVVDDGRLRGLITRHNMMRMGHYAMRGDNPDEVTFFVNRLRVRDIMVRNPVTVQVDDTAEHVIRLGQELSVGQFPVMEGEDVVGVISSNEVLHFAAHCVGVMEPGSGVTLAPLRLSPGVLGRIANVAEAAGAVLQAIYKAGQHDGQVNGSYPEGKVVLRFQPQVVKTVAAALETAGFRIDSVVESQSD